MKRLTTTAIAVLGCCCLTGCLEDFGQYDFAADAGKPSELGAAKEQEDTATAETSGTAASDPAAPPAADTSTAGEEQTTPPAASVPSATPAPAP